MKRNASRGISAVAFMASYSSPPSSAYALEASLSRGEHDHGGALNADQRDAISEVFAKTRETLLESRAEATCPEWSPGQHARRAS